MQSELADEARACGVDVQPAWGSGAKVLVADVGPEHFELPLRAFNVDVAEKDVSRLEQAWQTQWKTDLPKLCNVEK